MTENGAKNIRGNHEKTLKGDGDMKLLFCKECHDTVTMATEDEVRLCKCRKTAGKYLSDRITAVITKASLVFGIDNNSFLNAAKTVERILDGEMPAFEEGKRYDFFFTGWIPTVPGEVIVVDTPGEVAEFDYELEISFTSQNPSTDFNETHWGDSLQSGFLWWVPAIAKSIKKWRGEESRNFWV